MDKIRDAAKKAKQFEELTGKMREAKRFVHFSLRKKFLFWQFVS